MFGLKSLYTTSLREIRHQICFMKGPVRAVAYTLHRWTPRVPCLSLSTLPGQTDKEFISGYEDIEELQNAPENVKRIFSLENANQHEKNKMIKREISNTYDCTSKRTVADLTLKINTLQNHCTAMPKDKHNKVFLQWLMDQRSKKLRYLKKVDFERYLEIINELNIIPIESTHSKWNKYKFRKFKIGVEVKEKSSFLDKKIIT